MMFVERCSSCDRPARGLCAPCRAQLAPPPVLDLSPELDHVHGVFSYVDDGAHLVQKLKFRNRRRALGPLADALGASLPTGFDLLVPVPASPTHRRERGYDLPELLGRALSRRLDVPIRQALRRTDAGTQHRRTRVQRLQNDGFVAVRSVAPTVLLIDDVATTGATARSCARALRAAGADTVELCVLAVTPG